MGKAWRSHAQCVSQIEMLANRNGGLWRHLMGLQKKLLEERNKRRSKALVPIKHLNDLKDVKSL